ncbi:MAG: serine hydrolase [Planctomycetes bacterium]|nr:serine hydrolase [Planctomycetota bacterium]
MPRFPHRLFALLAVLVLAIGSTTAQVTSYFDVDGAYHQQQYNQLKPNGYRMIALSIYGSLSNPSYAATWVLRGGPDQVAFHGLTAAQYQTWSNTWWPLGYRPKILTATGSALNPRFAGAYELQTNPTGWTSHGLTATQFNDDRKTAQAQGLDVTAVDVYGNATDIRYIASFGRVDAGQHEIISDDHASYVEHFDALTDGHARPVLVGFNDSGSFVSVWQSNDLPGGWVAHSDMSAVQYQALNNIYWNQGKYPISLQGSGSGSSRRFAAVWAQSDLPAVPTFSATGVAVPQLATFDAWVQNWMQQTRTRATALAIVKDGRLVFARGYTNAPSGYPITQPTSLFEIASCSKPITAIAMHQHFERPQYGMAQTDTLVSWLPFLQPLDPLVNQISLNSLLTHRGGWDRDKTDGFDPMFHDYEIVNAFNLHYPINKSHIMQFMMTQEMLDFVPDSQYAYSNFGFSLLGIVLEFANPGWAYDRIIGRDVFSPLGLTRPKLARSLRSQLWPGEVTYHPYVPALGRTVHDDNRDWVATQYGAANKENMDSHGGWVMAAPDYAKILAAFDLGASNPLMTPATRDAMWTVESGYATLTRGWRMNTVSNGNGGTVRMHHHSGKLSGNVSFVAKREDGLSFVFFTNGDKSNLDGGLHGAVMSALADTITSWPTHDLFPTVGIPSFVHQNGSLAPYGNPCLGSSGFPQFTATALPEVGQNQGFRLSNGPRNQLAVMILGLAPHYTSLAPYGGGFCALQTDPIASFLAVTSTTGTASFTWPTPQNSAAIGLTVHTQAAVFDPPANPLGLITTRAIAVTLGGWQ